MYRKDSVGWIKHVDFIILDLICLQVAFVLAYAFKDHRMAMCMSLIAAGGVSVEIRDPNCVRKTFPDYFERLAGVVEKE